MKRRSHENPIMAAVLSDHNCPKDNKECVAHDEDDDNEDIDGVIESEEQLDQKKKRKKKKKKKIIINTNEENLDLVKGLNDISVNDNSNNGLINDMSNEELVESKNESQECPKSDQNKKKKKKNKSKSGLSQSTNSSGLKQTNPPTIPISQLFPDSNFPVGQEMEYPSVSQDWYSNYNLFDSKFIYNFFL